jgi:hypothetical protein
LIIKVLKNILIKKMSEHERGLFGFGRALVKTSKRLEDYSFFSECTGLATAAFMLW